MLVTEHRERAIEAVMDDQSAHLFFRCFEGCVREVEDSGVQYAFKEGGAGNPKLEVRPLDCGMVPQQAVQFAWAVNIACVLAPRRKAAEEIVLVARRKIDRRGQNIARRAELPKLLGFGRHAAQKLIDLVGSIPLALNDRAALTDARIAEVNAVVFAGLKRFEPSAPLPRKKVCHQGLEIIG